MADLSVKRYLPATWVVVILAIGLALFLLIRPDPDTRHQGQAQPADRHPHAAALEKFHQIEQAGEVNEPGGQSQSADASPLDSVRPPAFRADQTGRLLVDEQARVDLELVYALHQGPQVLAYLDSVSTALPELARQELRSLYQRYVRYDAALMQRHIQRKQEGEMTLESAEEELQALHELRKGFFGEQAAQAMYGQEERQAQELQRYIRDRTDPKLPLSQRAEQAQAAWLADKERSASAPTAP